MDADVSFSLLPHLARCLTPFERPYQECGFSEYDWRQTKFCDDDSHVRAFTRIYFHNTFLIAPKAEEE